jgi:hypothetical protein
MLWAWRPVIGRKLFFVTHHLTKREMPRKPGVNAFLHGGPQGVGRILAWTDAARC